MENLKINGKIIKKFPHFHIHIMEGKTQIVYRACEGYDLEISGGSSRYIAEIKVDGKLVHTADADSKNFNFYRVYNEADEEFMQKTEEGSIVYRKK